MNWKARAEVWLTEANGKMTKGMVRHYYKMAKESAYHTCEKCEAVVGKYPGRYPKYCVNCGCDFREQTSFKHRKELKGIKDVEPEGKEKLADAVEAADKVLQRAIKSESLSERIESWREIEEMCEAVHAQGGWQMVPWSPNGRVLHLEAIEEGRALFSVYAPFEEQRGRICGVFALDEVTEESASERVREIVEALNGDLTRIPDVPLSEHARLKSIGALGRPEEMSLLSHPQNSGDQSASVDLPLEMSERALKLPLHPVWISPDGGHSRIWLHHEDAKKVYFFTKHKNQWRQVGEYDSKKETPGRDLPSNHPSVKELIRQLFLTENGSSDMASRHVQKKPSSNPEDQPATVRTFTSSIKPQNKGEVPNPKMESRLEEMMGGMGGDGPAFAGTMKGEPAGLSHAYRREQPRSESSSDDMDGDDAERRHESTVDDFGIMPGKQRMEKVKPADKASVDPKELAKGRKVEMEHTDDPKEAERIALEHLAEDPHYYSKLAKSGIKGERVEQLGDMGGYTGTPRRMFDEHGLPTVAENIATYLHHEDPRPGGSSGDMDGQAAHDDGEDGTRNYSSAVAIVLKNGKQVLLGKSTDEDDRNGQWVFPGGGIDPEDGGDPLAAAIREAYEEAGVRVTCTGTILNHPDRPNVAFVLCEYVQGDIAPNKEFSAMEWFPLATVEDLPGLYPLNKELIQQIPGGSLREAEIKPRGLTKKGQVTDTKGAIKAYRSSPGDLQSAAVAAVHYAKRDKKTYFVIPGNSYGSRVWQIDAKLDPAKYGMVPGAKFPVIVAKPDGTVWQGEAEFPKKKTEAVDVKSHDVPDEELGLDEMAAINFSKINPKSVYDKYNRQLFGGELPSDCPVVFSGRLKTATGVTKGRVTFKDRSQQMLAKLGQAVDAKVTNYSITMSTQIEYDEDSFAPFLIHEMVHLWLMLHGYPLEQHGSEFRAKAKEVGQKAGMTIPLVHKPTGNEKVNVKARELGLLLAEDGSFVLCQLNALDAWIERARKYITSGTIRKRMGAFKIKTTAHALTTVKKAPPKYGMPLFRGDPRVSALLDMSKATKVADLTKLKESNLPDIVAGDPDMEAMFEAVFGEALSKSARMGGTSGSAVGKKREVTGGAAAGPDARAKPGTSMKEPEMQKALDGDIKGGEKQLSDPGDETGTAVRASAQAQQQKDAGQEGGGGEPGKPSPDSSSKSDRLDKWSDTMKTISKTGGDAASTQDPKKAPAAGDGKKAAPPAGPDAKAPVPPAGGGDVQTALAAIQKQLTALAKGQAPAAPAGKGGESGGKAPAGKGDSGGSKGDEKKSSGSSKPPAGKDQGQQGGQQAAPQASGQAPQPGQQQAPGQQPAPGQQSPAQVQQAQPGQPPAPGQPPQPGQDPNAPQQPGTDFMQAPAPGQQPGMGQPGMAQPQQPTKVISLALPPEEAKKAAEWLTALGLNGIEVQNGKVLVGASTPEELSLIQRTAAAFGLEMSGMTIPQGAASI